MNPSGVSMKADGLGGCSGVDRPSVPTQDAKQGLTALAGQGVMGGGFPTSR
jgi:hypothetical protein